MLILILGVALWWAPHLWKRIAPDHRAQFGDKGKGIVTGLLVVSVLLMIWGYRVADGPVWWGPNSALKGINNLLVLIAFYLFAAAGMKTAVTRHTRHPQLIGFSLWAFAHLLVNGDLPSFILFGGLLIWAFAEMALINAQAPAWTPPPPAPVRKEVMAAVGALIVFGLVALIHTWLGYNPFGG
ncbi:NnrU family protein [Paracoccus sp. TK19116]|uniref:NnrU family protein n=1 Tax=Paracoccus albicereus TaxID=2922394 RepID=A0ABT1MPT1_9RHOB|nr:NnrU family protein [Paracoccus albicereus]MCQ0970300.1 NnrU family protein [Paracoccus albicereus]